MPVEAVVLTEFAVKQRHFWCVWEVLWNQSFPTIKTEASPDPGDGWRRSKLKKHQGQVQSYWLFHAERLSKSASLLHGLPFCRQGHMVQPLILCMYKELAVMFRVPRVWNVSGMTMVCDCFFFFSCRSTAYNFNPKPANPSFLSHSLVELLNQISPTFKKNFSALQKKR